MCLKLSMAQLEKKRKRGSERKRGGGTREKCNSASWGRQKRLSLTHCQINSAFFFRGALALSPAPVAAAYCWEEKPPSRQDGGDNGKKESANGNSQNILHFLIIRLPDLLLLGVSEQQNTLASCQALYGQAGL